MEIFRHPLKIQYYPKKIIAGAREGVENLLKPVSLEYCCENDYIHHSQRGLAYMRRARLLRITTQAYLQGAFLSYPDLVLLLSNSLSTLKRDVKEIQAQGILIPLGRGLDEESLLYPARALDLYLGGAPLPLVLKKTFITEGEFREILENFQTVYQAWEAEGTAELLHRDKSRGGVTPPLQGIAPILLDHFYRVYKHHGGSELLGWLKKEISTFKTGKEHFVY